MQKDEKKGYVKKDTMYMLIGMALVIGFVSGAGFAVYRMGPDQAAVSSQAGPAPAAQGQGDHNIAVAEEQANRTPDDPQAWIHLGHAYFDADRYEDAIRAYTKALAIAPGNIDVLTDLGVMYRRSGQPDKAIETFDRAMALSATHEQSRFNKGVVLLFDKKDRQKALETWRELLKINPGFVMPNGQPLKEFIVSLENNNSR